MSPTRSASRSFQNSRQFVIITHSIHSRSEWITLRTQCSSMNRRKVAVVEQDATTTSSAFCLYRPRRSPATATARPVPPAGSSHGSKRTAPSRARRTAWRSAPGPGSRVAPGTGCSSSWRVPGGCSGGSSGKGSRRRCGPRFDACRYAYRSRGTARHERPTRDFRLLVPRHCESSDTQIPRSLRSFKRQTIACQGEIPTARYP